MNERITGNDTTESMLKKMSEGNPGGLRVCIDILTHTPKFDPTNAIGGIGPILLLDTLGIYGSRIWMLYKDVCGERLPYCLATIRGFQLGIVSKADLNYAIDNYGDALDVAAARKGVEEQLPGFARKEANP